MKLCLALVLLCVAMVAGRKQVGDIKFMNGRAVSSTLTLNNPFDAGSWGDEAFCPDLSFVHAIEVLHHPEGAIDETAVNGLKFYCSTLGHHDDGYVTSATEYQGSWYGMRVCDTPFVTGFRTRVLEYQGIFTDDIAIEDFEAECNFGTEIIAGIATDKDNKFGDGDWSVWTQCYDGSAVCGLQTRVEPVNVLIDNTALTDVKLFCCPMSPPNITAAVPNPWVY